MVLKDDMGHAFAVAPARLIGPHPPLTAAIPMENPYGESLLHL